MSTSASQNKEGTRVTDGKQPTKTIKTEGPLSEKDEVKKAEDRMNKNAKSPKKGA